DIETDLLVVPIFEDDDLADEAGLDEAADGDIAQARARGEITGKPYDIFLTRLRGWKAARLALVGAGARKDFVSDRLRRIATSAGLAARQRRIPRIAIVHRPGTAVTPEQAAQVIAEGAILANFEGASYQTTEK